MLKYKQGFQRKPKEQPKPETQEIDEQPWIPAEPEYDLHNPQLGRNQYSAE